MKLSGYCFLSIFLPIALGAQTQVPVDKDCCGNLPEGAILQIRPAASVEVMNARRDAAAANAYGARGVKLLEEKVEIRTEKVSLLAGSEFLLGAHGFVIVPKGCTVTPSRGLTVLAEAPTDGKLQDWKSFQRSNSANVRLLPLTEAVMSGDKEALTKISEKIEALKKGGIAYVTTLNGNPVGIPGLSTLKL